ncbi:hypothetical protein HMI54_001597 [Coelomomyces lativittatus]|nr:hypothetical protein HMI54_001597 [Coelomomyces lativittatus]KAJ1514763.1 hypothetical protein HMI56_007484 [Coelomomyces lativittatus]
MKTTLQPSFTPTRIHLVDQSNSKQYPLPPGFVLNPKSASNSRALNTSSSTKISEANANSIETERKKNVVLRNKKAWDHALSGGKQIPMNLFMMYMSGNSLQIFSIFITVMMFWNPIKALIGMQNGFQTLEGTGSDHLLLWKQKFAFIMFQLVNMGLALYKCQQMGLLPTAESDWLAFMPPRMYLEESSEFFSPVI